MYVVCDKIMLKGAGIMAQTNINIRMDENLKKQFDSFCSEVGMSMSTALKTLKD